VRGIGDHQGQRRKFDAFLKQRVCADDDGCVTGANARQHGAARLAGLPPAQGGNGDSQGLEPAPEILGMLIRQQLGGSHQCDLAAHLNGLSRGHGRDQGLAAAYVALHQAQHRLRELQIVFDLDQHPLLRLRHAKRQRGEQAGLEGTCRTQWPTGIALYALAQQFERKLMGEQFFERQATLRRMPPAEQQFHRGVGRRPMHIAQRVAQGGQA
jgi:hypothetical protein